MDHLSWNVPEGVFKPTGTSELIATILVEHINQSPGDELRLLDLGCGSGYISHHALHAAERRIQLFGSDISSDAVKAATHHLSGFESDVTLKTGSLFEPWADYTFDVIVSDVSGVSEPLAIVSDWFINISCNTGRDGIALALQVIEESPFRLADAGGSVVFPVLSLSNEEKILEAASQNFDTVELAARKRWPLPEDLSSNETLLAELESENCIRLERKYGLTLWETSVYIGYV